MEFHGDEDELQAVNEELLLQTRQFHQDLYEMEEQLDTMED